MVPSVVLLSTLPFTAAAAPAGRALVRRDLPAAMVRSWQEATRGVVGGPGASSMFRAPASNLDVHWRLAAFDGTPPRLDPLVARELVDLAVVSAGLGWEKTARMWIAEGGGGVAIDPELKGRAATALADLDDPARAGAAPPPGRRARPRVRPGASFTMATSVDPAFWEDRGLLSLARASTWVQARDLGFDTLRLQLSTRGPDADAPWELGWLATARQGIGPGVSALAELRGAVHTEGRALPIAPALRGAIDVRVAPRRPVYLRAEAGRRPRLVGGPEDRVGLSLRANIGWRAPLPPPGGPPGATPPPHEPDPRVAALTPPTPTR